MSEALDTPVEMEVPGRDVRHTLAFRAALQTLDNVNLVEEFSPCIMKSTPKFFRELHQKAMKVAMRTVEHTGWRPTTFCLFDQPLLDES